MPSVTFAEGLLAGRVALLAGGGPGPAREIAAELAACGAEVVVAGPDQQPLDETAAACEAGRGHVIVCDPRQEDQVESLVGEMLERHGRIDVLVNSSGGATAAADIGADLRATWLVTQAVAARWMIENGGGRIVNVTPAPHPQPLRAAVENLTRVLSIEWSRYGIMLNAIASGRPEDHAALVAYLASPAGAYFSGSLFDAAGAQGPPSG